MRKGDFVVELGDDSHIGLHVKRHGHLVAVRWAKNCLRWHRRSELRMAREDEITRAKVAQPSTEKDK